MLPQCRIHCGIRQQSKPRTVSTKISYNSFGERAAEGSSPRSPPKRDLAASSKLFRAGPNFSIAEHSVSTGNTS